MPTVLVVDDSAMSRNIIKHVLGTGFEFLEAPNGQRALSIVRLLPVDLVVSDIRMDLMDGIELVTRLRAEPRPNLRALPVILVTSDTSDEIRDRAKQAGATDVVLKPLFGSNLAALAQSCLAEHAG
jgi:two-component system chemotaxis response regulator CheY